MTVIFLLFLNNLQYTCTYVIENKRSLCATNQKILSEKEVPCTNSEHSLWHLM